MRLSDLGNTRWTMNYPHLGTGPVPIDSYISPEYFENIRNLFANTWICTGKRVEEIPNPGDYFLENIEVTKASIIVIRGMDGKVRGFHNTCKHRGTQLLFDSPRKKPPVKMRDNNSNILSLSSLNS